MQLADPKTTILGPDLASRLKYQNGNTYQQEALITFRGWQYAVFYASLPSSKDSNALYVYLARRQLPDSAWETIVFDDYAETADDPHNTVQMGICSGDGTIHISFDHHCDHLRYRRSIPQLATSPEKFEWTTSHFSPVLDHLLGLPSGHQWFGTVTYPRLGQLDDDMFFSFRTGKAGFGSDHFYTYSHKTGTFTYLGQHLTGVYNNPYANGIDYRNGRLHITWTYRGWVYYPGWDDPNDTKHKQHHGPNTSGNNYDICYMYSDDKGYSWKNSAGETIADLRAEDVKKRSVMPDSEGITVFKIPKESGLSNQEAQAVDHDGGVHVLSRDCLDGEQHWKHYYRDPASGNWTQHALPGVDGRRGGVRGRLATTRDGNLYFILPGNDEEGTLKILKATKTKHYQDYQLVWQGTRFPWEVLIDSARLDQDGVLSIFGVRKENGERMVEVLDFQL